MGDTRRPAIKRAVLPSLAIIFFLLAEAAPLLSQVITTDVSQYNHKAWLTRDGAFTGNTVSVTQTTDGYLWVGSAFGLLRFDGITFTSAWPVGGDQLAKEQVRKVLGARDGSLWIGTIGLQHLAGGKMSSIPEMSTTTMYTILEDHTGMIWAAGLSRSPTNRICRINPKLNTTACFGDTKTFGPTIADLFEDKHSNVWIVADNGLWRCMAGNPGQCSRLGSDAGTYLSTDADDSLVEVRKSKNKSSTSALAKGISQPILNMAELTICSFLVDRQGGLWIGTKGKGVVHSFHGRVDTYTTADGLSSNQVSEFFQDREGNIWAATSGGVDRFRNQAIRFISQKQGLSTSTFFATVSDGHTLWGASPDGLNKITDHSIAILTKRDGLPSSDVHSLFAASSERLFISTDASDGLAVIDRGHITRRRTPPGDNAFVITSDGEGGIWMCDREPGLVHVPAGNGPTEVLPWGQFGNKSAQAMVFDPIKRGLWLVFQRGDMEFVQNGQVKERYSYPGMQFSNPRNLQVTADGTVWFGSTEGLTRLSHGALATLSSKNGLPCDGVQWWIDDDRHFSWLLTPCGVVRLPPGELDRWSRDPGSAVRILNYLDNTDGNENAFYGTHYYPSVTTLPDGRIAYPETLGLAIIDTHEDFINHEPPPVHINAIEADAEQYSLRQPVALSAKPHVVRIRYSALSFRSPQKCRFRYKLEGYDTHWSEARSTREAVYTNLPPGIYRFRVIASNDSEVWNEVGDTLDLKVRATFYQTKWFLVLCVAVAAVLLWMAYRLRVRYLVRQLSSKIEVQTSERLNVSRDLHDTLLQGVQGLLLSFHALSEDPKLDESIKAKLLTLGDRAEDVVTEGRDKIRSLRFENQPKHGLAQEVARFANLLRTQDSPAFDVSVTGNEVLLNPLVYQEVCFICREALNNAFKHAAAQKVEVLLTYARTNLSIAIRDDGQGFQPNSVSLRKREGHWGIVGMRERAASIGAKLDIRLSFPDKLKPGTCIVIDIPGSVAYFIGSK